MVPFSPLTLRGLSWLIDESRRWAVFYLLRDDRDIWPDAPAEAKRYAQQSEDAVTATINRTV